MKYTQLILLTLAIGIVAMGCAGAPEPAPQPAQEEQPTPAPEQAETQQSPEEPEEPETSAFAQQRADAERLKEEATAERDRALSVKANVAQRALFSEAEADFERGEEHFSSEEYRDAASAFESAQGTFHDAYVAARDQRERALRALETLDSDLLETADELERMQQDVEGEDDEM